MAKTVPSKPQTAAEDTKTIALGDPAGLPAFLHEDHGEGGLEQLKGYVVLPRVKVVQPLSREPYRPRFGEGAVVLSPLMQPLSENAQPGDVLFHIIPILFYPEWVTWNPRDSGLDAIRARSLDPRSNIAIKARMKETRREVCPDAPLKAGKPQEMRHLEHLNFVCLIPDPHPFANFPITISCASGEHSAGTRFNTLMTARRCKYIYACQFAVKLAKRKNSQGEWYGLDFDNPHPDSGVTPFIQDEARFHELKKTFQEMKTIYDERRLQVNLEPDDVVEGETTPAAQETKF